jgi:hypothetical protein
MVSSVVSTLQVEDPTRSGIFNKGPVTRSQDYTRMDDQYTFVVYRPCVGCLANPYTYQRVYCGRQYDGVAPICRHFDPLSEQAQKYTSLFEGTFDSLTHLFFAC